jgi:hypothetical protein
MKAGGLTAAPSGRTEPFTWSYWLRHCEGFRVSTPERPLGYVESVDAAVDVASAGVHGSLVVRTIAGGSVIIAVQDVAEIAPRAELVIVRAPGREGKPIALADPPISVSAALPR